MGAVTESRLLAFDGGNSKTDVLLVAFDGTVVARARSGPFTPHIIGAGPAVATVAPAVEHVLAIAGLGWAVWFLGPGVRPLVVLSVAPAAGAALITLGALVTVKLGLHPAEAPGVITAILVTAAGWILAAMGRPRNAAGRTPDAGAPRPRAPARDRPAAGA